MNAPMPVAVCGRCVRRRTRRFLNRAVFLGMLAVSGLLPAVALYLLTGRSMAGLIAAGFLGLVGPMSLCIVSVTHRSD